MTNQELIALRIKELRSSHEMTMEAFGNIVGVNKSTVFRWENGFVETLKANVVKKLSDHFGVSSLWLLGYDVPKEKESTLHKELSKKITSELIWLDEKQLNKLIRFIEEYIK